MSDKTFLLAAESEAEMEDWIKILDKVRLAAKSILVAVPGPPNS